AVGLQGHHVGVAVALGEVGDDEAVVAEVRVHRAVGVVAGEQEVGRPGPAGDGRRGRAGGQDLAVHLHRDAGVPAADLQRATGAERRVQLAVAVELAQPGGAGIDAVGAGDQQDGAVGEDVDVRVAVHAAGREDGPAGG